MKRITTILTTLLTIMCTTPTAAQGMSDSIARNPLDNLVIRAAVKESMFPEERVYLHFDNTAYYLGETMWFKAYVFSGEKNEPTNTSRVLYVELVAPEGYVIQTKKYKIENDGTCHGEYELNPLLLSGYYEIRAYTRYMLNRGKDAIFSRVFPVFDKVNADNWDFMNMLDRRRSFVVYDDKGKSAIGLERDAKKVESSLPAVDLKFYPEGGHLVEGIESNIAFELFGKDGININKEITILANGEAIMRVKPDFMGMGTFRLTPKKGVEYTAEVANGKSVACFKLPKTEDEGVVVEVEDFPQAVGITISHNIGGGNEIGCAVLYRGAVKFYERFHATDSTMFFFIDKSTLPEGVNCAVVFLNDSIPFAERMFFVTRDSLLLGDNETAKLKVTTQGKSLDGTPLKPNARIPLTIEREDGKPIENGSFSISVSDALHRQETSYSYNMYTYMLLGSEVKGYIPDAARYFDPANINRTKELDLIMMTRGWTSYDWSKLSHREAKLEQPIEKGIIVKGSFVKKMPVRRLGKLNELIVTNRPNTVVTFSIGYRDSLVTSYNFITDEYGEFRIQTDDFIGKRVAKLVPRVSFTNHKDSTFSFLLDRYFSPEMRLFNYWERNVGKPTTEEELPARKEGTVKINPFEYLLSQVEVVSKRKKERNYRPPRSEMRFDFLDEWEYAQDITYRSRKIDSWSRLYTEEIYTGSTTFGENNMFSTDNLSQLDRKVMPSGWTSTSGTNLGRIEVGSNFGYGENGFFISDPAFYNTLSAADILRSAFWRHNLDWCYWIQSMVVMGEYSPDSVPQPDEQYLKGIAPEKMLNFKEIVIRSDEKTRKQFPHGHMPDKIRGKNKGQYNYSSFYTSFGNKIGILPRELDKYGSAERLDHFYLNRFSHDDIPNYVACFIPNREEEMSNRITPLLYHRSSTRYTMVYGYNESKQFYSPDYSRVQPDSIVKDYRRTLFWTPEAKIVDGKIEVVLYNNSSSEQIAVDIEGYSNGTFYSNNGNIATNEVSPIEKAKAENTIKPSIVAGIHDPDLLVHSFRINEEGRTLYKGREYRKAFVKFSEAATLGYSDALYNLAVCYLNGEGTEADTVQAFRCFRRAANMKHVQATHNLANCYLLGIGTAKNDKMAARLYEKSGNMGFAQSQVMVANCYLKGIGFEQDSTMADKWYRKAMEQEAPTALYIFAEREAKADSMANKTKRQLRKSPAIELFKRAAEAGNTLAQYQLARFYENGYYVRKSKKKAFKWYLQAAGKFHPLAMERVAECYEKGRGTKKDEHKAAYWYSLALKYGSELAQQKMEWYNIFRFFEE